MEDDDILKQPYAEFLESFIRELSALSVRSIGVCVMTEDGTALTGYYDADPSDKALFAHHFSTDAMFDQLEANGAWLREVVEEADENDEED